MGRRALLIGAGSIHVLACLLYLTTTALGPWLVTITVLHGAAGGALFAGYFTYAADIVPAGRRAEGIAIFGLAGLLPTGLAPVVGEWVISSRGFIWYFVCAGLWALLSLLLSLTLSEMKAPGPQPRRVRAQFLKILLARELVTVMFTTLTFGIGVAALFTFLAPFARASDLGDVGRVFVAYAIAAAFVRLFGVRLADTLGPRRVLLPALGLLAAGLWGASAADRANVLMLVGGVCGAAHGFIFPLLNTVAVNRTSHENRGTVVSLYTAMFDLGAMVGAPLLGAIARVFGYHAMYLVAGGIVATGFAVMAIADNDPEIPLLELGGVTCRVPTPPPAPAGPILCAVSRATDTLRYHCPARRRVLTGTVRVR
jgi:predicted MFS family arabinose efflux permease